jgi:cytochrome c peroxidase
MKGKHMRVILGAVAGLAAATGVSAAELDPVQSLGKKLFFDTALSVNGNQSCSSCHDPDHGFGSPHGHFNAAGAVVQGSVEGRFGNRKPPSMAYASESPVLHHIVDEGDITFVGGAFLDGRATGKRLGNPTADQAQGPFLNPLEMGLPHAACVVDRVLHPRGDDDYAPLFAAVWGPDLSGITLPDDLQAKCADPDAKIEIEDAATAAAVDEVFAKIAYAISAFEKSTEVDRFSSRYDRWLHGQGELTAAEQAGLKVFTDEKKGNCAACHVLSPSTSGKPAVFTDWTFDNLGVPKNRDNPFYDEQGANPVGKAYIDPGLGGFLATDPVYASYATENMGRHQVPTLRNLTKGVTPDSPKAYMHNGYFKTLEGVVHFYNTRDVLPACKDDWASEAEAMAQNCWPAAEIPATVNKDELGDLKLTAAEEADLVAFLKTLDDE